MWAESGTFHETLAELGLDEGDNSVYAEAKEAAGAFMVHYEKVRAAALLGGSPSP